jgi:hypothetical protein
MLPGDQSHLPLHQDSTLRHFPIISNTSLTRSDLMLTFRLIGLECVHLLQTPLTQTRSLPLKEQKEGASTNGNASQQQQQQQQQQQYREVGSDLELGQASEQSTAMNGDDIDETTIPFSPSMLPGLMTSGAGPKVRMRALLEAVRKGRVLLLNMLQSLALLCISLLILGSWPLISVAVPIAINPSPPLEYVLLFLSLYIPLFVMTIINAPATPTVLKSTPRKNNFSIKEQDYERFLFYLCIRVGSAIVSIYLSGWFTSSSLCDKYDEQGNRQSISWTRNLFTFQRGFSSQDLEYTYNNVASNDHLYLYKVETVQDIMSLQCLLQLIVQMFTLLHRGQKLVETPSPYKYRWLYICAVLVLLIHMTVLFCTALGRGPATDDDDDNSLSEGLKMYTYLDYIVWISVGVLPLGAWALALWCNSDDDEQYKNYLSFLRLDFDTRLGMHSPR